MLKRYDLHDGTIVSSENEDSRILVFVSPEKEEINFLTTTFSLDEHTCTLLSIRMNCQDLNSKATIFALSSRDPVTILLLSSSSSKSPLSDSLFLKTK